MATITLDHISKVYPNGTTAVSDLSLEVAEGEFMILVGPSGCGKTTALRMVAGLEDVTEGEVKIGERRCNDLSPRDRDIAMVFQNYALYPHMTVAENIGFALRLRHMSKGEIKEKVDDAARILGLTEHLDRKPAQLSGGQRQRVAMGRAIVREPAAFLMDEPLSNLDAKLRVQMRAEVARIQRRVGVATLYVTHDQTEAMTMGDRVAVLRTGELQQCDTPQALYDAPANLFVAAFIGSPAMNLYQGVLDAGGASVRLGDQDLDLPRELAGTQAVAARKGQGVIVGIRPEDLTDPELTPGSGARADLEGKVDLIEELGSEKLVHFHIDASRLQASDSRLGLEEIAETEGLSAGEIGTETLTAGVARMPPASRVAKGGQTTFRVATEKIRLFDPESGETLHG